MSRKYRTGLLTVENTPHHNLAPSVRPHQGEAHATFWKGLRSSLDSPTLPRVWTLRQQPHLLSLDSRIAQDNKSGENRRMKTAYVVRELVSLPGESEFLTHYEYGTFRTYKEANECAIATKNPRCFPQREQFLGFKQEDAFVN